MYTNTHRTHTHSPHVQDRANPKAAAAIARPRPRTRMPHSYAILGTHPYACMYVDVGGRGRTRFNGYMVGSTEGVTVKLNAAEKYVHSVSTMFSTRFTCERECVSVECECE